jgi:ferredoxin
LRIALCYFTGTGNTEYAARALADGFGPEQQCTLFNIETQPADFESGLAGYDLVGFGSPVYAFGIPRPVELLLRRLPKGEARRVFLFMTVPGEALGALSCPTRLLRKRGYDVVGSFHLAAPSNVFIDHKEGDDYVYRVLGYTERQNPGALLATCRAQARDAAQSILAGERRFVRTSAPRRLASWFGRIMVRSSAWQMRFFYYANSECDRCGLCVRSCPMRNIRLGPKRPRFGWRCAFCYRCVNLCPAHAVRMRWPASVFDNRAQYVCPGWRPPRHEDRTGTALEPGPRGVSCNVGESPDTEGNGE